MVLETREPESASIGCWSRQICVLSPLEWTPLHRLAATHRTTTRCEWR